MNNNKNTQVVDFSNSNSDKIISDSTQKMSIINNKQKDNYLWQRYLFWRDIGDANRANYWLKRIEEFNIENK